MRCQKIIAFINHPRFPLVLLGSVILAFLIRIPTLLLYPRLWAEEGRVFLKHAIETPLADYLTIVYSGYYTITPTLSLLAGTTLVDLEHTAYITTAIAFLLQLLPYLIVIFGTSTYWQNNQDKLIVVFIMLTCMHPMTIWLNTLCSQFHLLLASVLILFSDLSKTTKRIKFLYIGTLSIAVFSGPMSCFLTLPFFYVYYHHRSRFILTIVSLLTIASIFHLFVMMHSTLGLNEVLSRRSGDFIPAQFFASLVSYTMLGPFTGTWFSTILPDYAYKQIAMNMGITSTEIFIGILLSIVILTVYFFWRNLPKDKSILLLGTYLLLSILLTLFSVKSISAMRYGYVPSVLFTLMVLITIQNSTGMKRFALRVCLVWILGMNSYNFLEFYHNHKDWKNPMPWKEEVLQWRKNPEYKLRVQPPFEFWRFHLYPERKHCPTCKPYTGIMHYRY